MQADQQEEERSAYAKLHDSLPKSGKDMLELLHGIFKGDHDVAIAAITTYAGASHLVDWDQPTGGGENNMFGACLQ